MTPRVSHVTAGRACHMLPWGARVTCYSGAPLSHGRGEDVDRKEISFFCVHDTRQFTAKVRSGQVTLVPGSSAYCLFSLAKAGIVQPELLRKEARDAVADKDDEHQRAYATAWPPLA